MATKNPYESPQAPAKVETPGEATYPNAGMVRYHVVLVATLVSVLLYLTRFNIGISEGWIRADLGVSKESMSWVQSAFFFSYALAQVPSGWFSDRFGARRMMVIYIIGWSIGVCFIGLANSFAALFLGRLVFGVFQAGAYPTANVLLRRWATVAARGSASSTVALGGRIGGTIAPILTAAIVLYVFAQFNPSHDFVAAPSPENVGGAWRSTFFIYGAFGLAVAALFGWIVADYPSQHSKVTPGELALIGDGNPAAHAPKDPQASKFDMPLMLMAKDRNMLFSSLAQLMVNITWTFSTTLLPQFMKDRFNTPVEYRGYYTALPMVMGVIGMILGGILTDALVKRLGPRLGRAIPMGATKVIGAIAFIMAGYATDALTFALLIGLMALSTDLGVPALWATTQEIGGRHAGAAIGWGNMWGNIGSGISAPFFTYITIKLATPLGLPTLPFWIGGIIFGLSAICGLSIDATKPIEPEEKLAEGA